MSSEDADFLEVAGAAARAAGAHALQHSARRREVVQHFAHDVKLQLDRECQQKAEEAILRRFPRHAILGEEGGRAGRDADAPVWIIDPIDGTVNFFHGLPLWCSAVAVRVAGQVRAGVVFIPALDEWYQASACEPATCNGHAISVSATGQLEEALVLTGLSKHSDKDPAAFGLFRALAARVQKVRLMGAAAVDICHVASGQADGYVETGIHLWDVAAAGFIAERAGARVEVLERFSDVCFRYLCTNGRLHDKLLDVVRPVLTPAAPR